MENLTHTKRRDFLNCPRYFMHRHEHRLRLKAEKPGRRRGTAFGSAIFALADSGIPLENDPITLREVVSVTLDSSYAEAYQQVSSPDQAAALALEQCKILELVVGYVRKYGIERGKREVVFDQPLINPATGRPSRTFKRAGKIDGLISLGGGRWRIVEDKLVSQIQRAMIDRLPLDMQSSEYVDALRQLGLDAEVSYRHTLLPTSEPKLIGTKKTGGRRRESLVEYTARLEEDIHERPEHYFDEQILFFPEDRMDDYRRGRWGTARKILDARLTAKHVGEPEAYPMNPSKCWEFGGCEFIPLCTRGEEARVLYVQTEDNPELRRPNG